MKIVWDKFSTLKNGIKSTKRVKKFFKSTPMSTIFHKVIHIMWKKYCKIFLEIEEKNIDSIHFF